MSDNSPPAVMESANARDRASSETPPEPALRRRVALIATLGLLAVLLATVASFGARAWWLFDLINHFSLQLFWASFLLGGILLLVRRWRTALLAAMLLALYGWSFRPFYTDPTRDPNDLPEVRVMTFNVWAGNRDYERVIGYLRRVSPDIVVLVEVDEGWRAALETLALEWPHRRMMLNGGHFGIAILSRLPLDEAGIERLSGGIPIVFGRATINGTPVAIIGVHLDRPMSASGTKRQARQMAELVERLRRESPTRLVLGDFNSTSWSAAFSDFALQAGLRDSRTGLGIQPSWPSFLPVVFRIPIHHCLASADMEIIRREIGPSAGSDHLPVIVDLKIPARLNDQE